MKLTDEELDWLHKNYRDYTPDAVKSMIFAKRLHNRKEDIDMHQLAIMYEEIDHEVKKFHISLVQTGRFR